ncbi:MULTISPECIES: DUF2256 domain-containing protein [Thalassospira]|uniref:DUF2256 domain-containing protein n=1 Tax=Thalassospira aquimaris TaxID=3037796 RepID=A0ABT6GBR2_9PROT|nr:MULTISPECIES: DUF2256 domain-containing protein [Thalassospira]MDG4719503.1 DUF2256 domain-containing protein [Thalassospira sp. FZY0004]
MPRNANGPTKNKADLPEKVCVTCNRPFLWRRKWKSCWDTVRYCSERCRNARTRPTSDGMQGKSP